MNGRYVVRYFVVWLPPHHVYPPHPPVTKVDAKCCWYWNADHKEWSLRGRMYGTQYKTREEAEGVAIVAASMPSEYGSPVGCVRTSRQMVRVNVRE